ncbi:MAG: SRPBCC family protein [Acidimicrobiia bacterium]|nr:SRPBCC family protein [Acidimicrobiia bacterium]
MRHARASLEIEARAGEVWRLISEFEYWPTWGPTVVAIESAAKAVGPGVTGRVKTIGGLWLPFRIIDVEPDHSWNWRVLGIPMTGHTVADLGDGRTKVEFTVPIVLAPYVLVLRRGLRRLKLLAEATQ